MKLFLVHCGFYDEEVCEAQFESHVNLFVVAETWEEARALVRGRPIFRAKKMHVDGVQEVRAVDGWSVELRRDETRPGQTVLVGHRHRDLAPKPADQ